MPRPCRGLIGAPAVIPTWADLHYWQAHHAPDFARRIDSRPRAQTEVSIHAVINSHARTPMRSRGELETANTLALLRMVRRRGEPLEGYLYAIQRTYGTTPKRTALARKWAARIAAQSIQTLAPRADS